MRCGGVWGEARFWDLFFVCFSTKVKAQFSQSEAKEIALFLKKHPEYISVQYIHKRKIHKAANMSNDIMMKRQRAIDEHYEAQWDGGKGSHHPDYEPEAAGEGVVKATRETEELLNAIIKVRAQRVRRVLAYMVTKGGVFEAAKQRMTSNSHGLRNYRSKRKSCTTHFKPT
eukprot:9137475-Pyramimonas_sp.AAC.1